MNDVQPTVTRSGSAQVSMPVPLAPPKVEDEEPPCCSPTLSQMVSTLTVNHDQPPPSRQVSVDSARRKKRPAVEWRDEGYADGDDPYWDLLRSMDKKVDQALSMLRFLDDASAAQFVAAGPAPPALHERGSFRRGTRKLTVRRPPAVSGDGGERLSGPLAGERISNLAEQHNLRSCMEAVKEDERRSFGGAYDDEGRLTAQSMRSMHSRGQATSPSKRSTELSSLAVWDTVHVQSPALAQASDEGDEQAEECSLGGALPLPPEVKTNPAASNILTSVMRKRRSSTSQMAVVKFLDDPESGKSANLYSRVWSPLIMFSFLVSLVHTLDQPLFSGVAPSIAEAVFEFVFLLEVLVRLWGTHRKLRFCLDVYNIIDCASCLPIFLRVQRGFQVMDPSGTCLTGCAFLVGFAPVIRLLKMLRRFQNFHLLLQAFRLAVEALPVLIFIWASMALVSSAVLFAVEPRENIPTFAVATWCAIVTMTTVGYGDVTPVSDAGRGVVIVLVASSILYTAIPLGIIGSAFSEVWNDRDRILLMERTRKRLTQAGYEARDIPYLFKIFDANNDEELDLDEFKTMLNFMKVGLQGQRVIDLFELFDNDGSGAIDDREFVRGLFPENYHEIYGHTMSEREREVASPTSTDGQQVICLCGTEVPIESNFCRKCGAARDADEAPPSAPASPTDGCGR